jgi:hypothetical protein
VCVHCCVLCVHTHVYVDVSVCVCVCLPRQHQPSCLLHRAWIVPTHTKPQKLPQQSRPCAHIPATLPQQRGVCGVHVCAQGTVVHVCTAVCVFDVGECVELVRRGAAGGGQLCVGACVCAAVCVSTVCVSTVCVCVCVCVCRCVCVRQSVHTIIIILCEQQLRHSLRHTAHRPLLYGRNGLVCAHNQSVWVRPVAADDQRDVCGDVGGRHRHEVDWWEEEHRWCVCECVGEFV